MLKLMETDPIAHIEEDGISSLFDQAWKYYSKECLKCDFYFTKVALSAEEINNAIKKDIISELLVQVAKKIYPSHFEPNCTQNRESFQQMLLATKRSLIMEDHEDENAL